MKTKTEKISPFVFAMITMAIIISLRGLPVLAKYGLASIFFYGFSAFFFLIPVALIAAELTTTWPEKGGIFLWVAKAFGDRWGCFAAFMQCIPIFIWYPTALSFIAAALSYIFMPELSENKYYIISVVLVIYWSATFINFKGVKASGNITTICMIFGTMLPAAVIIVSGMVWLFKGNPSQISFSLSNLIPDFSNVRNIVFLAGALLTFSGMEISAVHINEVDNPKKNYPKAVGVAVLLILVIYTLATLAISIVIPKEQISLVSGVVKAFSIFFQQFNLAYLIPIISFCIAFGAIGQILSMIIGPSRSMFEIARKGYLPPFFKKVNSHDVPVNILIVQGVVVTVFSLIFLLMPSVSSSFWMLSALVVQLYLIMYMLFYASAVRLKYKYPEVHRPYAVPGKKVGMWIVASIGFISAFLVFIITFWPPLDLNTGSPLFYTLFLIICILVMCSIPFIAYNSRSTKQ